ncbi:MAG: hypothetical protein ABI867_44085 [Kofleriaceae bacterium]
MQAFRYVGPAAIRDAVADQPAGHALGSPAARIAWWNAQGRGDAEQVFTYVVGTDGVLRVASRRSEHVACAGGGDVLAAGELGFERDGRTVALVTNQSTGYCPRVDCWPAIAAALDAVDAIRPPVWTAAFEFRRCDTCDERTIVKDDWFECPLCGGELPREWNF